MRRLHLFEFEDLTWFPPAIREAMTDFLSFMGALADKPLAPFAEHLERAMRVTGDQRLLDLASGGGGPALTLARLLSRRRGGPVHVTLTDLYPNLPKLELARREGGGQVDFVESAVDATRVPAELFGIRERGELRAGYKADVVLFDAQRVIDRETRLVRDLPGGGPRLVTRADGIESVIVNGRPTVERGELTGERAGQVLRAA